MRAKMDIQRSLRQVGITALVAFVWRRLLFISNWVRKLFKYQYVDGIVESHALP